VYAIVKFQGQDPIIFSIPNSGYVYSLSTMAQVEWVSAATVAYDGTISPAAAEKVKRSLLSEVLIKPFVPGDSDPLEQFRDQEK
jgi:hypothetical protein